ncbi:CNNM domain-containing protein [Streptosporangium sp. NPDC006007]|uniref:CNNM domain-containing protein n=1 Tax=Streptosporangium sp. NPDC006007 TaxID=3154575 RepID=UPI0033ABE287
MERARDDGEGKEIATVLQMILGELVPKNLALARSEPLARALASSTLIYMTAAGPLIQLFDSAANRLVRMVGIEPVEELRHGATLEELGHIIGESDAHGHLAENQADLLERALAFSDHTAEEVMVPRAPAGRASPPRTTEPSPPSGGEGSWCRSVFCRDDQCRLGTSTGWRRSGR